MGKMLILSFLSILQFTVGELMFAPNKYFKVDTSLVPTFDIYENSFQSRSKLQCCAECEKIETCLFFGYSALTRTCVMVIEAPNDSGPTERDPDISYYQRRFMPTKTFVPTLTSKTLTWGSGSGGEFFNDSSHYTANGPVTEIQFYLGSWQGTHIGGLHIKYGTVWAPWHITPPSSQTVYSVVIAGSQTVLQGTVYAETFVSGFSFVTSAGATLGPYGEIGGVPANQWSLCAHGFIKYFTGKIGLVADSIRMVFAESCMH